MKKSINIIEKLEKLGLDYSIKAGGYFIPSEDNTVQKSRSSVENYTLLNNNHENTPILDGALFLKSVLTTENALNVKLFV